MKVARYAGAALLLAGFTTAAHAAPVGVDGNLGAEWTGVPSYTVHHDATAPIGNFGQPPDFVPPTSDTTAGASYSVQVRDDGSYYYVGLQITGDAGFSAGNFANLYFDTDPGSTGLSAGSDVGFEVENNRYFIPGVPGYFDASPYLTVDDTSHPGTIELAIANSFFTSGPLAGPPYPAGYPVATGEVVTRLSQSFGYTVAGGDLSSDFTRLGSASVAAVPLPKSAWGGLALIGGLGLVTGAKRMRRQEA